MLNCFEKRKAVCQRLSGLYCNHDDLRHALLFVPVHFQQLLSAGYWKRIQFYGIRRRYESGYLCDYPLSAFPDTVCQ